MDVNFSAIVRRECKFWSPKECGRDVRGLDSWLELNSGFKEIKQAQRKCKFEL